MSTRLEPLQQKHANRVASAIATLLEASENPRFVDRKLTPAEKASLTIATNLLREAFTNMVAVLGEGSVETALKYVGTVGH